MRRSTSAARRACAVGTTIALVGLTTGLGIMTATSASAVEPDQTTTTQVDSSAGTDTTGTGSTGTGSTGTDSGTTGSDTTGTGSTGTGSTGTGSGTDTTGTGSGSTDTGSTGTGSGTDTTGSGSGTDTTGSGSTDTGSTGTGTGTDAGSTDQTPAAGGATAPAGTTPGTSTTPDAVQVTAANTVKIVGDATVGTTLRAETTGFAGPHTYAWTRDGDLTVLSSDESYTLTTDDIDHVVTLTVTDSGTSTSTSASTAKVTEDVAFADADSNSADTPSTFTEKAGVAYSHAFTVAAGSGTVTYSIGYSYPDEVDPEDGSTPEDYLPDGVSLDPKTGVLSGTTLTSGPYDFTVVASNGTSTATEYVEITVNPDAAVGVFAYASDATSEDIFNEKKPSTGWIIEPDGTITTIHQPADLDAEPTFEDGGQPTVKQGQSLWVQGFAVDQYGNSTQDSDEETGELPRPVVTSDVATDQIAWDDDEYAVRITFPHASTHHITVAQDTVSVTFPVTVVPAAATVAVVTPVAPAAVPVQHTATGRLAYTGTDSTSALPWALGLVLAGVGLIGARSLRRRRAQR